MRTFIAFDLTEETKQGLTSLQSELKKSQADVKWVEPKNIHLTLKFLGEISEQQVDQVREVLNKISSHFKPYEITLSGVGAFPKLEHPRVVWVGIDSGKNETKRIAGVLSAELEKVGFQKEDREFKSHLTIGRVRGSKNKDTLKSTIQSISFAPQSKIPVNHITLYQSTLTPQGPIYTPLHKSSLQ